MNQAERREVHFAGSAVAVEADGSRAQEIVDFLFARVPRHGDAQPHVSYRVAALDDEKLALHENDRSLYRGRSDAVLAELLMGEACRQLAERSRGGLLFHAAALSRQGRGLLLPGSIAAGKSTLTAWLACRGLTYLTDELVFVPHGSPSMQTFTRPLNLKAPSRAVLEPWLDRQQCAAHVLSGPFGDLIGPSAWSSAASGDQIPLQRILFPRYRPQAELSLELLSGAQGGLALMECLVNARNLPDHGFAEAARLARRTPAYRLSYSHFEQLGERIESLFQVTE